MERRLVLGSHEGQKVQVVLPPGTEGKKPRPDQNQRAIGETESGRRGKRDKCVLQCCSKIHDEGAQRRTGDGFRRRMKKSGTQQTIPS